MRYLVSGKEMKLLDQNTSQVFHVPELVLMEQASMAFVQKLLVLKQNKLSTALIACGSGNNGGDGLAIARLLREQGVFVSVWPAGEEEGHRTSPSYDTQKQICSAYRIPVVQKEKVSAGEASYDVVIDAMFGTGLSREISGALANDIDVLNQLSGWKVAVDIASGISSDDGAVLGTAFRADDTITFSFGKKGQYLWPGNEYCGKVHVVSMGITQESWLDDKPHTAVLEPEDLKKLVIEAFEGGPIPENLQTDVNDPTKAQKFFSGFTFKNLWLNHTESISCGYISEAYVDGTTLYMTLETPTTEVPEVKPDSFDNIPVAFVCENEKVQHEKGTVLKTISLKESGLSYTYDENEVETGALTLHFDENPIEDYLSLVGKYTSGHVYTYDDSSIDLQYDEATKTWYAPSETEGQQDSYKIYVTCDEDIPDKPTVEDIRDELKVVLDCITEQNHHDSKTYALLETDAFEIVGPYVAPMPLSYEGDMTTPHYFAQVRVKTNSLLEDYNTDHTVHTYAANNPDAIFVLAGNPAPRSTEYMWDLLGEDTIVLKVQHTNPTDPTDPTDPGTNPGGNGGDNDDDDDRYPGDNTVTRTINDDDVPLNDRPTNTTIIDDEDVPLADLPDDTVTIDDGEVPLKANPSTGDSLPFAAMAAAALSLGGVIVLNRKKK